MCDEGFDPCQERKTVDLLLDMGYITYFENRWSPFGDQLALSQIVDRRDLVEYLLKRGPALQLSNREPVSLHWVYGMCEPCFMSKSSLWGDFWDTILDRLEFSILDVRIQWPRVARYRHGYTRGHFEALWQGREEHCPYWNDEVWPQLATEEDDRAFHTRLRGQLCSSCKYCETKDYYDCYNCGICLLVFQFSCSEEDGYGSNIHSHNVSCPHTRVGYWEYNADTGIYGFRPKGPTDPDSDQEEPSGGGSAWDEDTEYCQPQSSELSGRVCDYEYEEAVSENGSLDDKNDSGEGEDSSGREPGRDHLRSEGHEELYDNPWAW
ncbi:hypothetical protein FIE12Z_3219 [Fusarium flagelliforme]|uniref:Uncharacterized protein n=1 Tax=Fusarium flagelliforme TaxID=2675880 RepID=A0A395MX06_9HYPO|nr:hypothetical protein FIE12Z_3219 [Fusarium flagelliforme]